MMCSIGGKARISCWRRLRNDTVEGFFMLSGPNQTYVRRLIQRAHHWSSPILGFQRVDELSKHQRTCGVKEQRPLVGVGFARRARRCPVSPFAWDRKRAPFGVAQAQSLDPGAFSELQHSKSTAPKGMEGMGYLCRSQRLTEPMCSLH
jgi:hypothetical protein